MNIKNSHCIHIIHCDIHTYVRTSSSALLYNAHPLCLLDFLFHLLVLPLAADGVEVAGVVH